MIAVTKKKKKKSQIQKLFKKIHYSHRIIAIKKIYAIVVNFATL
jgi:hypothetical protein